MRFPPAFAVVLAVTLAIAACAVDDADRVTVFAASSLTDVIDDLAERWEADGGPKVVAVLGGSNHLAAQLRDGAPADAFLTADADLLDGLLSNPTPANLIQGFAYNHLVVAMPSDGPDRNPGDLHNRDLDLVACAREVPCGDTTWAWFGDLPIDSYEPSVRAVVTRLDLGEADLGIVYATDVAARPGLIQAWPQDSACPCVAYAAAALTNRGRSLLAFLNTPVTRDVLTSHGFVTEPSS